jgi:nitroreductase
MLERQRTRPQRVGDRNAEEATGLMNETIKTLLARRTVRAFKPEQISDDELNAVVKAGTYAPSGGNQQAAVLVVVQDAATRATLTRMNQDVIGNAGKDPYYGAPTIIVALADATKVTPVEDATLALGNVLSAAFSLGLGSCWVHRERQMFASDEGKALLKTWGLEGDYVGVGSCVLGYPDCDWPEAAPRKDGYVVTIK